MPMVEIHKQNKKILMLALISAVASVLFSFVGSPFMRVLFISTKSRVFWTTATLLIGVMFIAGLTNYKIAEAAVYVGAVWMTLGVYSELEKRGTRWRGLAVLGGGGANGVSLVISLGFGLLFALAGYFLILKNLTPADSLSEMMEPLRLAMNKAFPDNSLESGVLVKYLPGIFIASLFGSLAFSFAFETKVTKMFGIKRERVASGLRWLEFRLSDATVWLTLISLLFVGLESSNELVKTVSINFLIIAVVALFFQGFAVIEFALRFFRLGLFTRTIIYLLIILQLAPVVIVIGLVDYWADFRKLIRKKIKTSSNSNLKLN